MRPLFRVAVVCAALLIAATALELILRAGGYHYSPLQIAANNKNDWRDEHAFQDRNLVYDPVLIWRPWSGQFSPFNPQGFRGPLIDQIKPAGTFRIVAVGDSNTFGWNMDDGANWPAQLQRLFASASSPRVEVVNAGVWGYSSFQGLRRFQEVLAFDPDLVLISFGGNDAHQVTVPDAQYVARHDRIARLSKASRKLRLAQLGVEVWDKIDVATGAASRLVPRVSVDEYKAYLREIINTGRSRRVRIVLLTRPFVGSSTDPTSWKTYAPTYNAATIEVGREDGIPVVDVYGAFRDRADYFDDESHFGVEGHRVAAELIYKALVAHVRVAQ